MSDILDQIQKDFEELKKIKLAREKAELIEQKTQEWMSLSSEYNTKLYEAVDDETKLAEAVSIKEALNAKQAEIDELNRS
jgi:predicted transcriptional regulator